jgi:hypothetical protein
MSKFRPPLWLRIARPFFNLYVYAYGKGWYWGYDGRVHWFDLPEENEPL